MALLLGLGAPSGDSGPAGVAAAQPALTRPPTAPEEPSADASAADGVEVRSLADLPWPARPGWRIASLRQRVPTISRVVLVPDAATYLACLADWSTAGRWPILIEDDYYAPMFIRAFDPEEVLRITASVVDRAPLPEVSAAAARTVDDRASQRMMELLSGLAALAWTHGPGEEPGITSTPTNAPSTSDQPGVTPAINVNDTAFYLAARWAPPGVVLTTTDGRDPARLAAVALAADRGQPLRHLAGDWGGPNDVLEFGQWERLRRDVQTHVAEAGFPWSEAGDLIDTVTIARNLPARYQPAPFNGKTRLSVTDGLGRGDRPQPSAADPRSGEGDRGAGQDAGGIEPEPQDADHPPLPRLAVTDGLGRRAPDLPAPEQDGPREGAGDAAGRLEPSTTTDAEEILEFVERPTRPDEPGMPRWGIAGWIFSESEAHAVYVAMSSIFLAPQRALLFDSYDSEREPWQTYEMDQAAAVLREFGLEVRQVERPRAGISNWWEIARGGLDAGVIFVNTMGNTTWFDLQNRQRAFPADVPMLNHPAMVHFVHSWSAQYPASRDSVGGRWIERGAYAYVGSVEEPYLQAFVPPTAVAARIVAGVPFLVAARHYDLVRWKIMTYGDPLAIVPPGGQPPRRLSPDDPAAPPVGWRAQVWSSRTSAGHAEAGTGASTESGDAADVPNSVNERPLGSANTWAALPPATRDWLLYALDLNPPARDPLLDPRPSASLPPPGRSASPPLPVMEVATAAETALRRTTTDPTAWAEAIRSLALAGRDDAAADVFRFLIRTRERNKEAVPAEAFGAAASAALGPIFRSAGANAGGDVPLARRQQILVELLDALDATPARLREPWKVDLVWAWATPWLGEVDDPALLRRLETYIRAGSGGAAVVDATRLADALRRHIGADAANAMIEQYRK